MTKLVTYLAVFFVMRGDYGEPIVQERRTQERERERDAHTHTYNKRRMLRTESCVKGGGGWVG